MSSSGPGIAKIAPLTESELKILSHVIAAPNQYTAAAWLDISRRHLRRQIEAINEKLGAETILQTVVLATIRGLVDPKSLPQGSIEERALQLGHSGDCRSACPLGRSEAGAISD